MLVYVALGVVVEGGGEGKVRLTKFSFVRVSRTSGLLRSSDRRRASDLFRSSGAWGKIGVGKMNCENSGKEEDGDVEIEQIG